MARCSTLSVIFLLGLIMPRFTFAVLAERLRLLLVTVLRSDSWSSCCALVVCRPHSLALGEAASAFCGD
jgi:hypothetical protein